jgi:hypothetical protein
MTIALALFAWWFIGAFGILHLAYRILPEIRVHDVLIAAFCGALVGPFVLLYYVFFWPYKSGGSWLSNLLNKRIL